MKMSFLQWNEYQYTMFFVFSGKEKTFSKSFCKKCYGFFQAKIQLFLAEMFQFLPPNTFSEIFSLENILKW